jgi:hypothetical protein
VLSLDFIPAGFALPGYFRLSITPINSSINSFQPKSSVEKHHLANLGGSVQN